MEQLVRDPGSEILHLQRTLVGREAHLQVATVVHLAVQLPLGLLRVLAVVQTEEGKVFLRVKEELAHLAKLLDHLLELLLCGAG